MDLLVRKTSMAFDLNIVDFGNSVIDSLNSSAFKNQFIDAFVKNYGDQYGTDMRMFLDEEAVAVYLSKDLRKIDVSFGDWAVIPHNDNLLQAFLNIIVDNIHKLNDFLDDSINIDYDYEYAPKSSTRIF